MILIDVVVPFGVAMALVGAIAFAHGHRRIVTRAIQCGIFVAGVIVAGLYGLSSPPALADVLFSIGWGVLVAGALIAVTLASKDFRVAHLARLVMRASAVQRAARYQSERFAHKSEEVARAGPSSRRG